MSRVATYVFLDLETTGLPSQEIGKTRITEISLIAVKRNDFLDTKQGNVPRVQHKVTLCLNPLRMIQPEATEITGLSNELLEHEPAFEQNVFNILNTFLNMLSKPVCLIAQNGLGFDFPILKRHIDILGKMLAEDLLCADCYHGFYDILQKENNRNLKMPVMGTSSISDVTEVDSLSTYTLGESILHSENTLWMKAINESTPVKQNLTKEISRSNILKAKRRFPWSKGNQPREKYKLKNIHERLLNRQDVEAHRAENDCIMALECAVVLGKHFCEWVDKNCVPFSIIKPMTPGVPLGY
ncbi:three-prime repair exonuclease 1-like [Pieris rapae]|uniref:three-prime repair exonuclease 1-like n=1 Tax=Pieris rapae TaxID=64459 RepID=UPI000B92D63F|nr:three-prime repair exonuclease 1-like [Pieris rapae]